MVGLTWLMITVVGVLIAPSVSGRLGRDIRVGGPAFAANKQIASQYGGASSDPGVLVVDAPAGQTIDSARIRAELTAVDARIAQAAPDLRVVSYAGTGNPILLGNHDASTIVLAYPPKPGDDMAPARIDALIAAAKAAAPDLGVHGTSMNALESGNSTGGGNSSLLVELLIGSVAALVVLAWVFGSLLAALPLMMALISVLTMQLLIYGITFVFSKTSSSPIDPSVQVTVALLGLGLSIDYSLLVVTRWREERNAGRGNDEAVHAAVQRAGHSVWFSGIVASLGLFALTVIPNSLVRGTGIAGLFIPSTATLVALTLLLAILSKAGPRMDWPRRAARRSSASRFYTWWSVTVIRHRIVAAVVGLGVLFGLAGTAATINIALPTSHGLATAGAYTDGLHALEADGFPSGVLTAVPVYVPDAATAPSTVHALDSVSTLRGAIAPTGAAWHQGTSTIVIAVPQHEVGSNQTGSTLDDIRHTLPGGDLVGGHGAEVIDQTHATYGSFPLLFAVVALVTFLLLARGMKSIILPLKAVLLNMLSVAASYGLLVLVFQHGIGTGTLWGSATYGAIDRLVPVLIFGFLFGISMDYEVFILARVREGYDRTGSTDEGVIEGLSRTGRLVTNAALILFFALASLSTANDVIVREIGAGLAGGVLLDAVIVRMLLLPALVSLFGRWNWWLPNWAAKALRIRPARPTAFEGPAHSDSADAVTAGLVTADSSGGPSSTTP
jgi:RND superfamily putative drug exporter